MRKASSHIAIVLCWVFFYPILSQSLHVIQHHQVVHLDDHHSCGHCCSEQKHEQDLDGVAFDKSNEHCLICEYEFSSNQLPESNCFIVELVSNQQIISDQIRQQFKRNILSRKQLRAPPFA